MILGSEGIQSLMASCIHVLQLWSVHQNDNALPKVKFEADLSYHSKAVNVLRFSPSGMA